MRSLIYAATVSLAVLSTIGPAGAMPVSHTTTAVPSNIQQVQFFFGGRNYC
jgi:hypothetical protein